MSKIQPLIVKVKSATDLKLCSDIYAEIKQIKESDATPSEILELICACLTNFRKDIFLSASTLCKLIKWKNNAEAVNKILEQLINRPDMSHIDEKSSTSDEYYQLKNIVEMLKNVGKTFQTTERIATNWCTLVILSMKQLHIWYANIIYNGTDEHTDKWSIVQSTLKEDFLENVIKLVESHPENDWYYTNNLSTLASWSWSKLLASIKPDAAHKRCWELVKSFYDVLMKRELVNQSDSWTIFGLWQYHIVYNFIRPKIIHDKVNEEYIKIYVPDIIEWHGKNEEELTKQELDSFKKPCDEIVAYLVANNMCSLASMEIDKQCMSYFEAHDYNTLTTIVSAYKSGDEKTKSIISKHLSAFVKSFEDASFSEYYSIVELLKLIFKADPNLIKNEIDGIEKVIDKEEYCSTSICQLLAYCVPLKPELFEKRGNDYSERVRKFNNEYYSSTSMVLMILQQIGFVSETAADRVVDIIDAEIKLSKQNQYVFPTALAYEYQIAQKYPKVFQKRLPLMQEYKKNTTVASTAQGIIDIVEGRSLEKVSKDVDKHDKDIKQIGSDVNETKDNVTKLDTKVGQQGEKIKENTQNIQEAKQGINALGQRVDVAEENIEKIDAKTVSNAPAWSKEVSKIMNPKTNNDWTLVAQRLNYSSSDIRGWATQPDPTMSMLAEFYTTNKTGDATKYLIKILTDVNRLDAVNIIKKYEKTAENVVADDTVYKAPPVVFISYQWGVQKNIKLLKEYIEKEGYSCWMDLGQMGGGDMLYEKINDGIRGAKFVILCMTELYTKSANCIREVNLANGLDKPMVPILLEKELSWPPPGSMGPILAGKLFIRFFQRDNEKTNDERFWPADNYDQLMDKIRGACGPPNKQVENNKPTPPATENLRNTAPSGKNAYQLCISCSPDMEPDMKRLERDLNEVGYKTKICNYVEDSVDEFQAEVYICCLALRYSKSSMASKELEKIVREYKKPLITLVMDKTEFPPTGQLKNCFNKSSDYIDCSKNNIPNNSNEFKDLVKKLNRYLPAQNNKSKIPRSDSANSLSRRKHESTNSASQRINDPSRRNSDASRIRRDRD